MDRQMAPIALVLGKLSVADDAIGKIDCGRSTGAVPDRSCRYRLGG